jgi:hypothetical protein
VFVLVQDVETWLLLKLVDEALYVVWVYDALTTELSTTDVSFAPLVFGVALFVGLVSFTAVEDFFNVCNVVGSPTTPTSPLVGKAFVAVWVVS